MFVRRVGAIGDVHAEDHALASALTFLKKQNVDRILCVGDIADGRGNFERCCELLADTDVDVVRGNHDRWLLAGEMRTLPDAMVEVGAKQQPFLENLPTERRYRTPTGTLLLCHGLGEDDMGKVGPDDSGYALESNDALHKILDSESVRYVINGHSHRPMVRTIGSITIINVGTLFRDHDPCFAVIDFADGWVRFHAIHNLDRVSDEAREHAL